MSQVIVQGYLLGSPALVILQGYGQAALVTLREAVAAWLRSQSPVTAVVGNAIYFGHLSQRAVYPCIEIVVPQRKYGHNLGGADGTSLATVSLAILANSKSQTIAGAEAIRNFAQGFRGTQSGVAILSCLLDDEADDETAPPDGSDLWIYNTTIEYRVAHRVPMPTSVTQSPS